MSVSSPMLGVAKPPALRRLPQRAQFGRLHPGQQQVLVVRDAQLAAAEALGQRGGAVHLRGRHVAGRLPRPLERQRHRAVARHLVRVHVAVQPAAVGRRGIGIGADLEARCLVRRRTEAGRDAVELGLRDHMRAGQRIVTLQRVELGIDLVDESLALGLDEDLDARLVGVVAPAVQVVDAHDGLDVDEDLLPGHEVGQPRADHRRATHATAHPDAKAHLARPHCAAVAGRCRASRWRRGPRARHGWRS
jgi:hypothetical protein